MASSTPKPFSCMSSSIILPYFSWSFGVSFKSAILSTERRKNRNDVVLILMMKKEVYIHRRRHDGSSSSSSSSSSRKVTKDVGIEKMCEEGRYGRYLVSLDRAEVRQISEKITAFHSTTM